MLNNSKLLNCFKLSGKISVYVPSTISINKKVNNKKQVDEVATLLSNCFGGATSTVALGYWDSPTAGLVKEKTTIVFAYCDNISLENNIDKVVEKCISLKKEMSQDSIALEINGEMYFI